MIRRTIRLDDWEEQKTTTIGRNIKTTTIGRNTRP
jgi:hypothetical protein